jgi:hypothetical protein
MPDWPPLCRIATTPSTPTQRTKPDASSRVGVEPKAKCDFAMS